MIQSMDRKGPGVLTSSITTDMKIGGSLLQIHYHLVTMAVNQGTMETMQPAFGSPPKGKKKKLPEIGNLPNGLVPPRIAFRLFI